jgi:hypothetical protein
VDIRICSDHPYLLISKSAVKLCWNGCLRFMGNQNSLVGGPPLNSKSHIIKLHQQRFGWNVNCPILLVLDLLTRVIQHTQIYTYSKQNMIQCSADMICVLYWLFDSTPGAMLEQFVSQLQQMCTPHGQTCIWQATRWRLELSQHLLDYILWHKKCALA